MGSNDRRLPSSHRSFTPGGFPPMRPRKNPLKGKHVVSASFFSREDVECVFSNADDMRVLCERDKPGDLLRGKVLACLFHEPTSWTASLVAAMLRLGGGVIPSGEMRHVIDADPDTMPDALRILEASVDAFGLRLPAAGAAATAAETLRKPLVNAGDGDEADPMQALVDLYAIDREFREIEGLTVTFVGDLRNGRTAPSLVRLLRHFDARVNLVSPDALRMDADLRSDLAVEGMRIAEGDALDPVLGETDVLYLSPVRDGWSSGDAARAAAETFAGAKEGMVVMRESSFDRTAYGLYVRMALLAMVLGRV